MWPDRAIFESFWWHTCSSVDSNTYIGIFKRTYIKKVMHTFIHKYSYIHMHSIIQMYIHFNSHMYIHSVICSYIQFICTYKQWCIHTLIRKYIQPHIRSLNSRIRVKFSLMKWCVLANAELQLENACINMSPVWPDWVIF